MPRVEYVQGGVAEVNAHIADYTAAYLSKPVIGLRPPQVISVQFSRIGAYVLWDRS